MMSIFIVGRIDPVEFVGVSLLRNSNELNRVYPTHKRKLMP